MSPRVLLGVVLFAAACYPKAGAPPTLTPAAVASATARWPGTSEASLSAGHDLFLAKCNACHDYPDLVAISEDRWPHTLEKMGNKAHLSPNEREEVLRYVLAARSEAVAH
jgi:hypothetical protein